MDLTDAVRRILATVPANHTLALQILRAKDSEAEAAIDAAPHLANTTGSLHSSGLTGLIEATGLAALLATARDDQQVDAIAAVAIAVDIHFHAPAKGFLVARCNLDERRAGSLLYLLDGHTAEIGMTTTVDVTNSAGAKVCTGSIRWSTRRTTPDEPAMNRQR